MGSLFLFFIIGFWVVAIPEELIKERIEGSFLSRGIRVEIEGLSKGLFYNLSIDKMTLKRPSTASDQASHLSPTSNTPSPSMTLFGLRARFDFFSLFRLEPSILINASFAGGGLRGNVRMFRNLLNLTIDEIRLEEMGFIKDSGIEAKGLISGTVSLYLRELKGDLRFSIVDAIIKDIKDKGYVPLSLFNKVRGFVEFNSNTVNVHSLFFEGSGIYGRIRDSRLKIQDLRFSEGSMEIMVDSDFSMPHLIELGLFNYKRAPGYYIIPLRDYRLGL